MAEISEIDDDVALRSIWDALPANSVKNDPIHVNDMDPEAASLIRRTLAQLPHISSHASHSLDPPLDPNRVTLGLPDTTGPLMADLEHLRNDLEVVEESDSFQFPRVAWEAVQLGLAKEKFVNDQIIGHVKEAEKIQKDIDLLLDLSAELTALKDDASEMSDNMRDLLAQLKERGIDLWKSEGHSFSKEQIAQLKSLSSAQVDKLRSNLQIIFTTKIQVLIQSIGAIMETLKDIIRQNGRLISMINQKMTGR